MTRDLILAELPVPQRCLLSLSAAGALLAADGPGDDRMLRAGRLLAEGGEPLRAARVLLDAAERALAAGSLSSAELLLTEAGRAAAGSEDLQTAISGRRAQVLLTEAGRPAEAASTALRIVTITDGQDATAATAMRLLLSRAAVMTGAWEDARTHLADIRRGGQVNHMTRAELEVIEAQVALGDARPGSRKQAELLAERAVATAQNVGRPDLACEALEVAGLAARLRDLDAAHAALTRALGVTAAAGLGVHRLRILNELGTVEMLRDARGDRLEQAHSEASRAGAVGVAAGISINIAALLAMTAQFDEARAVAREAEHTAGRLGLVPAVRTATLLPGWPAACAEPTMGSFHPCAAAPCARR